MGVFGIGPMELFVVMIVALLVLGPQRLPEVAAGVGKAVREFRKITTELTAEMNKVTSELTEIQQAVTHEVEEVKQAAMVNIDLDLEVAKPVAPIAETAPSSLSPVTTEYGAPGSAATDPIPVAAAAEVPAFARTFAEQVDALKHAQQPVNGYYNGTSQEDPFQMALLQLQQAPANGNGVSVDSQTAPEPEEKAEAAQSASTLSPQWYSGQWYSGT